MKLRLALFVAIIFLSVFEIQAQPGVYQGFSSFNKCISFAKDEIIFVGTVESIESVDSNELLAEILPNTHLNTRVKVVVEKIINGKLDKKKVEFFTGIFLPDLKVGLPRMFVIRKIANLKKSKSIFISERWSDKTFGGLYIKAALKEILISAISGKVIQRKNNSPLIRINEQHPEFVNNNDLVSPVDGITVEAIRLKDRKSFQTKTDKNGDYKLFDLEAGSYKIRLIPPKGFQEVENGFKDVTYKIQDDNERDRCYRQIFFELKKQ